MKTPRILFALVPLLCLAASSRHEAFGPLHFGMTAPVANAAMGQLEQSARLKRKDIDAADVRSHFVVSGTKTAPKVTTKDAAVGTVQVTFRAEPVVTEVEAMSTARPTIAEGATARAAWEVFQDIADAKFTRVGKKGEYPAPETFNETTKEVVTDTWESEGIRIELIERCMPDRANTQMSWVVLKATEIAPAK